MHSNSQTTSIVHSLLSIHQLPLNPELSLNENLLQIKKVATLRQAEITSLRQKSPLDKLLLKIKQKIQFNFRQQSKTQKLTTLGRICGIFDIKLQKSEVEQIIDQKLTYLDEISSDEETPETTLNIIFPAILSEKRDSELRKMKNFTFVKQLDRFGKSFFQPRFQLLEQIIVTKDLKSLAFTLISLNSKEFSLLKQIIQENCQQTYEEFIFCQFQNSLSAELLTGLGCVKASQNIDEITQLLQKNFTADIMNFQFFASLYNSVTAGDYAEIVKLYQFVNNKSIESEIDKELKKLDQFVLLCKHHQILGDHVKFGAENAIQFENEELLEWITCMNDGVGEVKLDGIEGFLQPDVCLIYRARFWQKEEVEVENVEEQATEDVGQVVDDEKVVVNEEQAENVVQEQLVENIVEEQLKEHLSDQVSEKQEVQENVQKVEVCYPEPFNFIQEEQEELE